MTRDSSKKHKQNLSDQLPEDIVNHIFCCMNLTNKNIIQLSLVSKWFRSILQKYSYLVFDGSDSHLEAQLKYVISTLERYQEQNILLEKFTFKLNTDQSAICSTSTDQYDRCIKLASAQKGLRFLSLSMPKGYNVPCPVFEVDSLMELRLENCRMQLPDKIAWRNLKELSLCLVEMGEGVFLNIIKSCPLIEALEILFCCGDIQFEYMETSTKSRKSMSQNLKDLKYFVVDEPITKRSTSDLILNFPHIENLSIDIGYRKTVSISSPWLKRVEYHFEDRDLGLRQTHFDAPNMVSFNFIYYWKEGENFPRLTFTGNSSRWISNIQFNFMKELPCSWLLKLKGFLKAISELKSICLDLGSRIVPEADELATHDPREMIQGIKFFFIHMRGTRFCLSSARAILNAIFLICNPENVVFQFKNESETDSNRPPIFEYRVKFSSSSHEEFMKVLKHHEQQDRFFVIFAMEY